MRFNFFSYDPWIQPTKTRLKNLSIIRPQGHVDIYYFFMRIIFFPRSHRDSNQQEDLEAYSTYRYYYTRFVHTIRYYAVGSHCTPSSDQFGYI